jgi:hypothetical protein
VRKTWLLPLLLITALALAACGGGGSSSGSGGSTAPAAEPSGSSSEETPGEEAPEEEEASKPASPEEAWAGEVTEVMTEFENEVSANLTEQIHTSTSQQHLEPLYSTYSTNLSVLGNKLENTAAKGACVAAREKMVTDVRKVATLTKTLSGDSKLDPEQYAAKAYNQGLKIEKIGHHLGGLTAEPSC